MGKLILTFGDTEIGKNKFYYFKSPIFVDDVDIVNILVSKNSSFCGRNYKYFIRYFCGNYKVRSLHITLPKTSAYVTNYDGQTKWMYFLIEDDDLLEKYDTIWDKVSSNTKKELDSKPAYNQKFLKTKTRSFNDEVTDFYNKEIPKVISYHTCLAVISFDFALNKDENYNLQVFLKECIHIEKRIITHIIDDLESSSDDSDKE